MPSFKEDSILLIAPGSRTTLAQLGLPESFTPASRRFRSRMFRAQGEQDQWEATKIRRKKPVTNGDAMHVDSKENDADYEEDPNSEEGACWPIRAGKIVNWSCFYALMEHVYKECNPGFHTPILLIAQPGWTLQEHEKLTRFFFERFKCPGFALMDSATAACYAHGVDTATIVDIGAEKADVTAVRECIPSTIGRSVAVPRCGGEALTERLQELLGSKGFSRAMCEQLKLSPICEVLPQGTPLPGSQAKQNGKTENPLTSASTGAEGAGAQQRHTSGAAGQAPRGPGQNTEVGGDAVVDAENDEGVLDIANIVTSGKMNDYLEKKEREKQENLAAKKKGSIADSNQAKPVKLKNTEREKATFYYEDHALLDALKDTNQSASSISQQTAALDEGPSDKPPTSATSTTAPPLDPTSPLTTSPRTQTQAPRRELTVGTERFQSASPSFLDNITSAIHRTIHSFPDPQARPDLWNNIIILGNGSAIRGLKDLILSTLQSRFLISPSSATIFTSELPSSFTTPQGTGANTPNPHANPQPHAQHGHPQQPHGVNPLLHAATTAAASGAGQAPPAHLAVPGPHAPSSTPGPQSQSQSQPPSQHQRHSSHAQAPTSIKLAKLPEYFLEWKDVGHEEAAFLGAQVAARCLFVVSGAEKGFVSRTEWNESGPQAVHEVSL